jgi:hypothetical protein
MGWTCCVCDRMVRLGPKVWEGRFVAQWGNLVICRTCERFGHDGIVIRSFPDLPRRIEGARGRFTTNAEGHIVIPPLGSN